MFFKLVIIGLLLSFVLCQYDEFTEKLLQPFIEESLFSSSFYQSLTSTQQQEFREIVQKPGLRLAQKDQQLNEWILRQPSQTRAAYLVFLQEQQTILNQNNNQIKLLNIATQQADAQTKFSEHEGDFILGVPCSASEHLRPEDCSHELI